MHPRIHAQNRPDAAALVMAASGETISYAALEQRANRGAHALRQLGLAIGDTLMMACENRPEFFDIYWATQRSGIALVPVSTRLKADEISYIISDSGAKALLITDAMADTARELAAARARLPGLAHLHASGTVSGLPSWQSLSAAQPASPIKDEANAGRMVYSSGTTGRPKGIRHVAVAGDPIRPNPGAQLFGKLYRLDGDTIYLAPTPLYHSAPLGFATAVQALGGTVESHTINHPDLTKVSGGQLQSEICGTLDDYQTRFGTRPTLFRPPYGSYNDNVRAVAASCGFKAIVMWKGSTNDGRFDLQDGTALTPGDIVLMHWRTDLLVDLQKVVETCKAQGFTIARLEDYLK